MKIKVTHNGFSLFKVNEDSIIPWNGDDVSLVYTLFKDTKIIYDKPKNLKPLTNEPFKNGDTPIGVDENVFIHVERPWLIERPLMYDNDYLTISEDGINNRPWSEKEIESIKELFKIYD